MRRLWAVIADVDDGAGQNPRGATPSPRRLVMPSGGGAPSRVRKIRTAERWVEITLLTLIGLVLAVAANATSFTLQQSVAITGAEAGNPGVVGSINPVLAPPSTGFITTGTVTNPVAQNFVWFEVALSAGSIDQLGASSIFFGPGGLPVGPGGAGYASDVARVEPGTLAADPSFLGTLAALYSFDNPPGSNLNAGQTSAILFFTLSDPNAAIVGDTVSFMVSPIGGVDFTVQGSLVPVPEPGAAMLIALGLVGLAINRSRIGQQD